MSISDKRVEFGSDEAAGRQKALRESGSMDAGFQEAPVESGKLVKIANDSINWNKSTTYTVLRSAKWAVFF